MAFSRFVLRKSNEVTVWRRTGKFWLKDRGGKGRTSSQELQTVEMSSDLYFNKNFVLITNYEHIIQIQVG